MSSRSKRIIWGVVILATLLPGNLSATGVALERSTSPGPSSLGKPDEGGISLQDSSYRHVVLELSVPDFQMDEVEANGQYYVSLSAPGLDDSAAPGQPRLPQAGALIGVPPSGDWTVQVVEIERQLVSLPQRLAPALTVPSPAPGHGGGHASSTPSWTINEATYGLDAFYPSSPVEVGEAVLFRDLRVVRLGLWPFRYNPARDELEHIRRLVVEVRFEDPTAGVPSAPDAWDPILSQAVVNYDVARGWRGVQPALPPVTLNPLAAAPNSFKVEVDADGLYELTYDKLQTAGFPVSALVPENLHLVANGQEVAIRVELGADGAFTSGDRILFFGQAAQGRYTTVNVYWLYSDETPGLRMDSRSVMPYDVYQVPSARWITTHLEENHLYDALHPEPSGDHWYWTDLAFLQTGCPEAIQTYFFDVPQLWTGLHSVTLRTSVQGYTHGDHSLAVRVNGYHLGDIVWDGLTRKESEFTFPVGWLHPSDNLLRLDNGDCPPPPPPSPPPNGMAFNYFELDHLAGYRAIDNLLNFLGEAGNRQYILDGFTTANVMLFDITDPTLPSALFGARVGENNRFEFQDETIEPRRYFATAHRTIREPRAVYPDRPSNLASPSAGANYLLIGHGDFLPATQPLVDLRISQGMAAMSVDVQDVYDEFSDGLFDPRALRDFLAYVASEWQILPTYVVLVGDGTIDFHDYLGNGWHNYLPAFPAYVELHVGPDPAETASDNELDPGGMLPIFQMGRLPVTSVAQTQALVAKIVNYETGPMPGFWNRRMLFVADNEDYAGSFPEYSDQVYETIVEPFAADRVHLSTNPVQSHQYDRNDPGALEAARAVIREQFVGGTLLVTYTGHSSHSQWAQEVLLHRDNVPALQNQGKLPVVLSMTCYTGAFHHPYYAPLDERLVVEPGGGAVAAWGATGAGVATGHRHLAQGFHDTVQGEESVTLGAATHVGMARLYTEAPTNSDLIDTYVLLGDPATLVNRFIGTMYGAYLPLVTRAD